MRAELIRWVTPPIFPGDKAKTRRARVLHAILILVMTFAVLVTFGNWLGGKTPIWVVILDGVTFIGSLIFYILVRRGEVWWTSLGMLISSFGFAALFSIALGTIRTPIPATYFFLIVAAGLLYDKKGLFLAIIASSLSVGGLIWAENERLLPPADYSVSITQWVTWTSLFGLGGGIVYWGFRMIHSALIRADKEIAERAQIEEIMHQRNAELTTLNQIGQVLSKLVKSSDVLERIYEEIGRALDNRNLFIALYDQTSQYLSFPVYTMQGRRLDSSGRKLGNGITDYIIRNNRPVLIKQDMADTLKHLGIDLIGTPSCSLVAVPMSIDKRVIGVIAHQNYEQENAYDDHHIELLTTIALQAAVALENARLYGAIQQELEERKRAEDALRKREREYKTLAENAPDMIVRVDRQYRFIYVNPIAEKEFGMSPSTLLGRTHREVIHSQSIIDQPEAIIRQIFETGKEIGFEITIRRPDGEKYFLSRGVPEFAADGSVESALFIHRNITKYKEIEQQLHDANLKLQAQVDELNDLHTQLREQAMRDPLTQLYNRRYLNEIFPREIARALRGEYALGVLMIDIDHFKNINDEHGHLVGDEALQAIANLIVAHLRKSDIVCRYGGEELVCLLPNTTQDQVSERAGQLCAAIANLVISSSCPTVRVTASIGTAIFPTHGNDMIAVLNAVDNALYDAKQAGRNCVRASRMPNPSIS